MDLEKIAKAKRHIDRVSREKVQADAQIKMLKAERERIYEAIKNEENLNISSIAEGEAKLSELDAKLEEETEQLIQILREIGVNI